MPSCPRSGCDGHAANLMPAGGVIIACPHAPSDRAFLMAPGAVVVDDATGLCPLMVEQGIVQVRAPEPGPDGYEARIVGYGELTMDRQGVWRMDIKP